MEGRKQSRLCLPHPAPDPGWDPDLERAQLLNGRDFLETARKMSSMESGKALHGRFLDRRALLQTCPRGVLGEAASAGDHLTLQASGAGGAVHTAWACWASPCNREAKSFPPAVSPLRLLLIKRQCRLANKTYFKDPPRSSFTEQAKRKNLGTGLVSW